MEADIITGRRFSIIDLRFWLPWPLKVISIALLSRIYLLASCSLGRLFI